MSKKNSIQIVLTAVSQGVDSTLGKTQKAMKAFNREVGNGHQLMNNLRTAAVQTVGALAGFVALRNVGQMLTEADKAAYNLEASLMAANREFNVGTLKSWQGALGELRSELRVFSEGELKNAASRTIDMTKRLGLSKEQMLELVRASANLSAGKTDLVGGIERTTAALRGEAESAEFLGLTLNENYVKAWYEAHKAHGLAWKDLTDLEKAQVRFNVLMEQAAPMAGRAANSITTFAGAMQATKAAIEDSIVNNENVVEAMSALAEVLRENGDEIAAFVAQVVGLIAWLVKFAAAHRELVVGLGAVSLGMWALSSAITTVGNLWRGLNAALVVLSGSTLPQLIHQTQVATQVSGLLGASIHNVGNAVTILAGAFAAFNIGYMIGTWLNSFEAVRKVAQIAIGEIIIKLKELQATYYEVKIAAKGLYGGDTSADEKKQRAIIDEIALYKRVIEDIKRQGTEYDSLAKKATETHEEIAESAEKSGEEQKRISESALKEMAKQYKQYVDKVKSLQDEIAGRQRSLYEKLRAMARTGMSDLGAWRDRKKEAEEYYQAAQRAAQAGNMDEAVKYADMAQSAYEDLNKEVKDGDKVLISQQQALKASMAGVKKAGELAISLLQKQKDAARAAAAELDKQAGGELSKKYPIQELTAQTLKYQDATRDVGRTWETVWDKVGEDGRRVIETIAGEISKLDGSTITIYTKHVEKKQDGGPVGFRRGGRLPGYGGGDRIHALLEAGEFIVRKEAVRRIGVGALHAINSLRIPALPVRMATGGLAGAAAGGGSAGIVNNYSLSVSFAGDVSPMSQGIGRRNAEMLLRELEKLHRKRA